MFVLCGTPGGTLRERSLAESSSFSIFPTLLLNDYLCLHGGGATVSEEEQNEERFVCLSCFAPVNVAGQHFSVVTRLFKHMSEESGLTCIVNKKLSIKVKPCVFGFSFQTCFLLLSLHKTT